MNKKIILLCLVLLSLPLLSFGTPRAWHIATIPFTEAAGFYTAISAIVYSDNNFTISACSINIAWMTAVSTLGFLTAIIKDEHYPTIRKIHKIFGFISMALSTVMTIAISLDDQLAFDRRATRYTGYAYSGLVMLPLFIFETQY